MILAAIVMIMSVNNNNNCNLNNTDKNNQSVMLVMSIITKLIKSYVWKNVFSRRFAEVYNLSTSSIELKAFLAIVFFFWKGC